MRYAILYDSHSGNTAHVAQTIRHTLPEAECLCFYSAHEALGMRFPILEISTATRLPILRRKRWQRAKASAM